jgi:hypothetical protein
VTADKLMPLAGSTALLPLVAGVHVFVAPEVPRRFVFIEGLSAGSLEHAGGVFQSTLGEPAGHVQSDLFRHEFAVTRADAAIDQEKLR